MATSTKPEGDEKTTAATQRGSVGRGPSYPALSIQDAIEKLRAFYNAERRNAAPVGSAAGHWGYTEKSSSTRLVAAALIQYGLMEDSGSNTDRKLKVSERGLDIVLDTENSPKRLLAIQEAVRAPKANAEVFARHPPSDLPSDQTLKYFLLREKGFNDGSVDGYIKTLRESIAYAKLDKETILSTVGKGSSDEKPSKDVPEVGDLIQWEASGVLRLEGPRRVRAKQEHDGNWWVFIEGSETGIPMDEAIVMERGAAAKPSPPSLPIANVQAPITVAVDTGEQEVASGKFGKAMSYRLLATGEIGPKELGKIIKLLEAYKEALEDDDD